METQRTRRAPKRTRSAKRGRQRYQWVKGENDQLTRADGEWLQTIQPMNPGPGFVVLTEHQEHGIQVQCEVFTEDLAHAKRAAQRQRNPERYMLAMATP